VETCEAVDQYWKDLEATVTPQSPLTVTCDRI